MRRMLTCGIGTSETVGAAALCGHHLSQERVWGWWPSATSALPTRRRWR